MIAGRKRPPVRPIGSLAVVYPSTGTSTPPSVGDFFGGRVFDRDGDGSEDDFDFHRGVDMSGSIGDLAYAPAGGARLRYYQGHYYFKRDSQIADWPLVSGTGGTLAIVADGTGPARTSGEGAHVWRMSRKLVANDDWVLDLAVPDAASWDATGKTIAGLRFAPLAAYHPASTEFVQIRYDGTTVYCDAENAAAGTKSTTFAVADVRWLRIEYASGTVRWRTADDEHGNNFTLHDSLASTFTGAGSGATWALDLTTEIQAGASPATIDIEFAGGADSTTVPRFGNWVRIATGTTTWSVFHLDELDPAIIERGTIEAGQSLGRAGRTGLDYTSGTSGGRVRTLHFHSEVQDGTSYTHDSDDSLNPLANETGRYPRPDSADAATISWTNANDPNGSACARIRVTLPRNADGTVAALDRISYVGASGSHVIDYQSRTGLDPADPDNPDYESVYQVPSAFNSASSSYVLDLYYELATYGAFRSVQVLDTAGVLLAEYPFMRTAAAVLDRLGATPTNLFDHDQASGSSVCALTGTTLAQQGSPTVGVASGYGHDDLAVQMADNTGQRMEAASSATFDQALDSWAWLCLVNFGASPPAATRHWLQKIGTNFYSARLTSTGRPEIAAFDGTLTRSASLTTDYCDGLPHWLIVGCDRTAGQLRIASTSEVISTALSGLGTLTNAGLFAIGRSTVSAPQTHSASYRFTGADAEYVLSNAATILDLLP